MFSPSLVDWFGFRSESVVVVWDNRDLVTLIWGVLMLMRLPDRSGAYRYAFELNIQGHVG